MDDPGEPHDLTDPFAQKDTTKPKAIEDTSTNRPSRPLQQASTARKGETSKPPEADKMDEMKSILERLREEKGKERGTQ